jgi:NADH dehydrogenase
MLPVLPLAGADTRFQPVYAGDVAEAIARAVDGAVAGGRTYELGGPEIKTLRELVAYMLEVVERRRLVVSLPLSLARLQATVMEALDLVTLGLLPDAFKLTRDQVVLLQRDNVVSDAALREGRTLQGLGITPTALEALVPSYLVRFRKRGQFERSAAVQSAAPDDLAPRSAGPGSQFQPGRGSGPAIGQNPP